MFVWIRVYLVGGGFVWKYVMYVDTHARTSIIQHAHIRPIHPVPRVPVP